MHRIDGPGATTDNRFTEGNPATGLPATVVTADWANAIQEEVARVIEEAGLTLTKANNGQLFTAISNLIAAGGGGGGGGGGTTALAVSIADAANYYTGANVEAALQELGASRAADLSAGKVAHGVRQLTTSSQTELVHAGEVLEITSATGVNYTLQPDGTVNIPIGKSIHVAQGGAGKVTVVPGSGVTLKKGASFNARTMEQEAIIVLIKVAANTWRLGGQLEAA